MGSRTVWLNHQHANHLSKAVKTWNNLVWSMVNLHKQPKTAIMLCVWAMRGMSWEQGHSNSLIGDGGRSAGLFGSMKIWVFKCKEWRVVKNNSNEDRRSKDRSICRYEDHKWWILSVKTVFLKVKIVKLVPSLFIGLSFQLLGIQYNASCMVAR